MKDNLEKVIKDYLTEISGVEIDVNDDIIEMGLLQSIDFIMLINFIAKTTKIKLTAAEIHWENFRSLASILAFITTKLAK